MADAYTTTTALNISKTAYDRLIYFALRPQLYFDQFADVKPTTQSMPGTAVVFTLVSDLATASTPLSEAVDVDAVALTDSQVTVNLIEYGNAVLTTAKLRATGFVDVEAEVANVVGFNAGISIDTVARNTVQAGTNVRYSGTATSRGTVAATHVLTAANVRRSLADLRGANVMPWDNGYYGAIIHPDVSYDLRSETGAAAWRDPHTYSQPEQIWSGEIGAFEGFRFVESPRAPLFPDTGTPATVDVYRTIFMGRQAIAKAYTTMYGPNPTVVFGAVVDKLRRFQPIGWYALLGYSVFRQASLRAFESASSIGAN